MEQFHFIDIGSRRVSADVDVFFPGWDQGDERVCIFSPHDDDAILGAGYALLAALSHGAEVFVYIFCRGNAGYSEPEQKNAIEAIRARETDDAYGLLGVKPENILRFGYSDFSMLQSIGWQLTNGREGSFRDVLLAMRRHRITRLLVPNPYREHLDHWAVGMAGTFYAPQAGDPVLADWEKPFPIRGALQYSTWGDFSPEDALVRGREDGLRANRIVLVTEQVESRVSEGIFEYKSQLGIIRRLVEARKERKGGSGLYAEAYLAFDPRPPMDYSPYVRLADRLIRNEDDERKEQYYEKG